MNKQVKYSNCYIAFIDILGFKDLLAKNTACSDIFSIFELIKSNSTTSLFYNGEDVDAFNHIKCYIMSDSIVLYIDASIKESFFALVTTCSKLQISLLCREQPILVRGGISKGDLFVDKNIIFGAGLTEAYLIESNISRYPRIVFSKALLRNAKEVNTSTKRVYWDGMIVSEDVDEYCFVNFMSFAFWPDLNTLIPSIESILIASQSFLDTSFNQSIREKYLWLKHFLLSTSKIQIELLKSLPQGKDFLQKWKI